MTSVRTGAAFCPLVWLEMRAFNVKKLLREKGLYSKSQIFFSVGNFSDTKLRTPAQKPQLTNAIVDAILMVQGNLLPTYFHFSRASAGEEVASFQCLL